MCHTWSAVLCQAALFMIMRSLTAAILLLIASLFWLCMLPLLWRLSDVVLCHLEVISIEGKFSGQYHLQHAQQRHSDVQTTL